MTIRICQKIGEGQDETRARANHLGQHHRTVLLMVNGEKACDDILVQLQPLGMTQAIFDELEGGGYICPHLTSSTTTGTVSTDEPAPTPASIGVVPAVPSKEPTAEGYQHLYHFYTEAISRYLGLRGYLLGMKVEKAGSVAELIALRDTPKAAPSETRGGPEISNVIARPDLLIDETTG